MRWKVVIIVLSAAAALAFGLGTEPKPQRPVINDLLAAQAGR